MRFNRAPIVEVSGICICPRCMTESNVRVKGTAISWAVCERCWLLGPIATNKAEAIDKWNEMVWEMEDNEENSH